MFNKWLGKTPIKELILTSEELFMCFSTAVIMRHMVGTGRIWVNKTLVFLDNLLTLSQTIVSVFQQFTEH